MTRGEILVQIWILIFSGTAAFLLGSLNMRTRKLGFIVGLISQPMWFFTTFSNRQYGMLIMCSFYTFCWIRGIVKIVREERKIKGKS